MPGLKGPVWDAGESGHGCGVTVGFVIAASSALPLFFISTFFSGWIWLVKRARAGWTAEAVGDIGVGLYYIYTHIR